jgi:hypothetical protein
VGLLPGENHPPDGAGTAAEQTAVSNSSENPRKQVEVGARLPTATSPSRDRRGRGSGPRQEPRRSARLRRRVPQLRVASALTQIAIVLASASIITGMVAFVWTAGVLGVLAIFFCVMGFFFPHAIHIAF